jgi:hypothetical protein
MIRFQPFIIDLHQKSRELDYGAVISKLRTKIQTLPRLQPKMELTEGKWYPQYRTIEPLNLSSLGFAK